MLHRIRHGGARSLARSRVEALARPRFLTADLLIQQGFNEASASCRSRSG